MERDQYALTSIAKILLRHRRQQWVATFADIHNAVWDAVEAFDIDGKLRAVADASIREVCEWSGVKVEPAEPVTMWGESI